MKSMLRVTTLLAVLLSTSGTRAAAPSDPTPLGAEAPSILLVTFDTVRADRIGAYGDSSASTPTLDGLSARGVLFESAVSPTPTTLPSHASILTGTYPSAHGVHDDSTFTLDADAMLISEVFQERGFRTAAFVGTYILDHRFGLNQGFETYHGPAFELEFQVQEPRRAASEVVDDAIAWFEQLDPGERFFVWVHFYDPHERIGHIQLVNEAGANFSRWGEVSTRYATAWQRDQNGRQFLETVRSLMLELRERNPGDPTIPYLLGAVESELRNYEAAIPLLERAARDRPFDSVNHARLADTYAKTQRTEDAISEMQKALDLVAEQPL